MKKLKMIDLMFKDEVASWYESVRYCYEKYLAII